MWFKSPFFFLCLCCYRYLFLQYSTDNTLLFSPHPHGKKYLAFPMLALMLAYPVPMFPYFRPKPFSC